MSVIENKPVITCGGCGLVQFARSVGDGSFSTLCRKCGGKASVVKISGAVVGIEWEGPPMVIARSLTPCVLCGMKAQPFPTLAEIEAMALRMALNRADGNAFRAAAVLGIGRSTMYRKLKDLGVG